MAFDKNEFEHVVADALAHHKAGRLDAAEFSYRAALKLAPGHPAITHNLGVLNATQGRQQDAIALFDAVLAVEPYYAAAHYNRAAALQALGRRRDAIVGFSRAASLDPGHYEAHRALAFLWLAEGDCNRALDHFARTYELRRGEDRTGMAEKSLSWSTRGKLQHDSDQFRHISMRRRDGQRFELMARLYDEVKKDFPLAPTKLSPQQIEILGEDYNTAIYIAGAPTLREPTIAARPDREKLEQNFDGIAVLDNLLTPPALAALKRHLLESTIWHDFTHIPGFVASYLEDGLACPLLLQIIDELRAALPNLLGKLPLTQAWAFKAIDPDAAVDVHADDAALSVNFWLTPDSANTKATRGGLRIGRTPPPADWGVTGYQSDRKRLVAFLERPDTDIVTVPYGENLAALFDSRLAHGSDAPKFDKSYENHRINVSLLFGTAAQRGDN